MKYAGLALLIVAIVLFLMLRPKPDVSGDEARRLVAEGAKLIDVRTKGEFADSHIPGAANIPVGELEARLAEVPKDKPVVLYCRSGARSTRAAGLLKQRGYERVHNLGGMSRW